MNTKVIADVQLSIFKVLSWGHDPGVSELFQFYKHLIEKRTKYDT